MLDKRSIMVRTPISLSLVLAYCAFVVTLWARTGNGAAVPSTARSDLLRPEQDPFYAPPQDINDLAPGAIIRTRTVQLAQFGLLPENVKEAYQLLYKTSYSNGTAAASVTTILVPHNAVTKPQRIVSHQMAEDATTQDCAPSFILQNGVTNNTVAQIEIILMNAHLQKGYIVVTPDYELPESQYTVGKTAARGTLDGLRAVLNFSPLVQKDVRYALEGYSGGALATGWAVQEQPAYAPELTIQGASMGGLPVNITATLLTINEKSFAGVAFAGLAGQLKAYDALRTFAAPYINATGQAALDFVNAHCLADITTKYANADFFSTIFHTITQAQILASAPYQTTVAQNTLGLNANKAPLVPLYIYMAKGDELVGYEPAKGYVDQICAQGAPSVHFVSNLLGGHITEEILGSSGAINFISARLDGRPNGVKGCQRDTVLLETIQEGGLLQFGTTLVNELLSLLGLPIGAPIASNASIG